MKKIITIIVLIIATTPLANMGNTISIRATLYLTIDPEILTARIDAENVGKQTARDLAASMVVFGKRRHGTAVSRLAPGKTHSFHLKAPVPANTRGRFPVVGEVKFQDATGAVHSALTADEAVYGDRPPSAVHIDIANLDIEIEGNLTIRVRNRSVSKKTGVVRIYLPAALSVQNPLKPVQLNPGETKRVSFRVSVKNPAVGGAFPVYVAASTESGGIHDGRVASAVVRVRTAGNPFAEIRWYLLAGMAPLLVAWGIIGYRRRRSGGKS